MVFKRFNEILSEYGLFFAFTRSIYKIYYLYYNYIISKKIQTKGLRIHPSANLIGLAHIKIGLNFFAGKHLRLETVLEHKGHKYNPQIIIGDNVTVVDFVHIAATSLVEIGDNVLMGSNIYITDHNHGIYSGKDQTSPHSPPLNRYVSNGPKVVIGDNVWIGEYVSILPGVTIEQGSIVGANSVVTKDIPPFSIAVGTPAKVIKEFDFEKQIWVKA
jgi:lipopolysaccharide O-acetyltransferase